MKGRILHVVNGDSVAQSLRYAGVDDVTVWGEVLCDGPVPADVSAEEWCQVRAHFYAACGWGTVAERLDGLLAWERGLEAYAGYGEVVLWYEHDLHDQLLLISLLDRFSRRDLGRTALSLVSIDRFPGVERFIGLGQLSPEQLASLLPARQPVTPAQLRQGRTAWRAYCSPDPMAVQAVASSEPAELPFLRGALLRHLAEYPSVENGLGLTDWNALVAVDQGHTAFPDLFRESQRREVAPFLGDSGLWLYLRRLAAGPRPLLTVAGSEVRLTAHGRDVLAGRADGVRTNGIDRWLGGVHLRGQEVRWRWDGLGQRLIPQPG
jgi:hypothetical protein